MDRMKATLRLTLALSLFPLFGNGQDGAVSTTPPPEGWGVHGNLAWSQAQREAERSQAANAARQKKALMEAMASYRQKSEPITTADQYLAAHQPVAPPRESAPSPVRRDVYVPQFENVAPDNVSPRANRAEATSVAAAALPVPESSEKRGLFSWMRGKKPETPAVSQPLPPAAAYPEPSAAGVALTAAPVNPSAVAAATQGKAADKPSLFGRLFAKEAKEAAPVEAAPTPASPPPSPESPATEVPSGAPLPPGVSSGN